MWCMGDQSLSRGEVMQRFYVTFPLKDWPKSDGKYLVYSEPFGTAHLVSIELGTLKPFPKHMLLWQKWRNGMWALWNVLGFIMQVCHRGNKHTVFEELIAVRCMPCLLASRQECTQPLSLTNIRPHSLLSGLATSRRLPLQCSVS